MPKLGSPDQVENRIRLDNIFESDLFQFNVLQSYFDFKDDLNQRSGFNFATDYNSTYFGSNSDVGEGKAGSGVWRIYGNWDLVGRNSKNSGSLIFKVEHRHRYTTIPPKSLGLDMGYVGFIAAPFNNDGFRTTNLYWRQRMAQGRISMVVGFLDVTDFFDVYGLASPWMHFTNLAFSTGAAAVNLPNDGYLGLGVAGWITERVYAIAGFGDINSDPTRVFNGFDTFFNKNEYFKHVEVGLTSSKDYMLLDNIHVAYWHRDATSVTGDPNGWGLVFSASRYFQEKYFPFLRYAYTKDAGSLLQNSLSVGFGYQPKPGRNLLAGAFNWGQVNETTFGEGLKDQWTLEIFYRLQLSKRLAITPDIQWLLNPALNPVNSSVFIWGFRGRLAI
ncbi:carbohydrate porin [Winogradskyella aurantiaca]|uniref:carbohydrate porin n=1 Tax=Winogradskyella aurantiaca TaxID=2219558 RepID=UPI0018E576D5|nr:carbohydrate porin [Winogradskyella aurantiaca]